jgi:hypothetical protein
MLGWFYAEALIFAETGQMVGAIQVAGCPDPQQLPFFVAACDYVIIGDEFYAGSAYISREPTLLGSLVGQDIGKAILMVSVILFGIILNSVGTITGAGWAVRLTQFIQTQLGGPAGGG